LEITGIICEYNPFHLGHRKQLAAVKAAGSAAVCVMSGNFVQRGAPAVFDKSLRARAAVACGADLVLELPLPYSLSSAEGFAAGGVSLLSGFCSRLCFGAETPDAGRFLDTAEALLREDFSPALRARLDQGLSFPAARQAALSDMGADASLLSQPNNILGVEYCKAILKQHARMTPWVIPRQGGYHDLRPHPENPSATALRQCIEQGDSWEAYVPEAAADCFRGARIHTLRAGELAILARLRTMTEEEFEALPYGSEGLWRKFMHAVRQEADLESILTAVKSKRYTRSRLDRMAMCAFLGLSREDLEVPAPYARVLALNDRGREVLNLARQSGAFPNAGQTMDHPFQRLEDRWGDLYGLFAQDGPEAPGAERRRRVAYQKA